MGAIGTWHLAAKYPDRLAAVGPFSGTGSPAAVAGMKGIPQIVVHGDADPTVNVSGSRNMVAEMKRLGVEVTYIEVPGGNHTDSSCRTCRRCSSSWRRTGRSARLRR